MPRLTVCIFCILTGLAAYANELPVEEFGHIPVIENPTISHDGRYVAAILNTGEVPSVVVAEFGSRQLSTILQLKHANDRIEWIRWANDDRLLVSTSVSQKFGAHWDRLSRLHAINWDGSDLIELRRRSVSPKAVWNKFTDMANVVSMLPADAQHILIQLYDERDSASAVFKVGIYDNKFEKLFVNTYEVRNWYADDTGHVSLGLGIDKDVLTFWYRRPGQEEFQKLHERVNFEEETFVPVTIEGDKAVVLSDHETAREAIWLYDIASGEFEELLFAADDYDVDGPLLDNDRKRVIGAAYFSDYEQRHYFDESDSRVDQLVRSSFPQYHTVIAGHSQDWSRLIVTAERDDSPRKYFWLDIPGKRGGVWFSEFPGLEAEALAKVEPISFQASDGTPLSGYLTMPDTGGDTRPALIVYPHGGPQSRDYRYFDPFVQFFANRGYAVLQVNFRGSTGFGSEFESAGYREWGGLMQQDVYDAIDWLANQDRVDLNRACVVGASYGGYVALTAAIQRPQAFRCFVSIAGVTDLEQLVIDRSLSESQRIAAKKLIGDPNDSEQKAMLRENSPFRHIDRIVRPVLLIHGDRDTRVRIAHSTQFYNRAKALHKDVEFVELPNGTHDLDNNQNRLATFRALDAFLKKHLN